MHAMSVGRRDFVRLSALAASTPAQPALADTKPLKAMRLLILGGTVSSDHTRSVMRWLVGTLSPSCGRQQKAWPGPVEELLGDRNGDLKALEGRDWTSASTIRPRCRPGCATPLAC